MKKKIVEGFGEEGFDDEQPQDLLTVNNTDFDPAAEFDHGDQDDQWAQDSKHAPLEDCQPPIPLRGDTSSGTTAQARPRRTSTSHPKKRQRPREEHSNAPSSSTNSASRRLRAHHEPSKSKCKSRDANATGAEASLSSTAAPSRPPKWPASPYDADSPARESPKKAARRSTSDEGYKSEFDHSIDELVSTVKTSGFRTSSPGPSSRAASTSKAWTTAHPTLPS
ncbi:hypothetical protein TRAPUB_13204, partial [Trametes pubescens]